MAARRTPWHRLFAAALRERAPPGFEVRAEVQLTEEPQRADIVLVRGPGASLEGSRPLLPKLWQRIRAEALLELKTVRHPIRPGDLARLLGYGAQHFAIHRSLSHVDDLLLVLVVASVTPTLELELARMGWLVPSRYQGYGMVWGCPFPAMLAVVDEIIRAERDDLLAVFSHDMIEERETAHWLLRQFEDVGDVAMQELEGWDEVLEKFVESLPAMKRLAGLTPEERLRGLAPEERLAGLAPEERLAGLAPEERLAGLAAEERLEGLAVEERLALLATLPVPLLRALPEEVLDQLPSPVRAAISRRVGGSPRKRTAARRNIKRPKGS